MRRSLFLVVVLVPACHSGKAATPAPVTPAAPSSSPAALDSLDLTACDDRGVSNGDFVVADRTGAASLFVCRDGDASRAVLEVIDNGDSHREQLATWTGDGTRWALQGSIVDETGPDALILWSATDAGDHHAESLRLVSYAGGKQAILWSGDGASATLDGMAPVGTFAADLTDDSGVSHRVTQLLHGGTLTAP
ncbi:MAG TPA: hypothetical protein VHE35_08460 [Kofleriaceae bacterium]|nr:hypothetical protein [Kofleriaceae bacterium]